MKKSVGKRIKKIRKSKNLTQTQLAEILDVDWKTISNWETGQCIPKTNNLKRLSEYFNTTEDYILGIELKRKIRNYTIVSLIVLASLITIYCYFLKPRHHQIISGNSDFKVIGEIIYNQYEKVLRIDSIKVLNKEKYKDIKLYDCNYYFFSTEGMFNFVESMYGEFDSWEDPTYDFIETIESIKIETEIDRDQIKDFNEKLNFIFNYESIDFNTEMAFIPLKLE